MIAILNEPPQWSDYNISGHTTPSLMKYYEDVNFGGPSLIKIGPDQVATPVKDMITKQENTGFYKIMNIYMGETSLSDLWILTKNLTSEYQKKMEDLSLESGIKRDALDIINYIRHY